MRSPSPRDGRGTRPPYHPDGRGAWAPHQPDVTRPQRPRRPRFSSRIPSLQYFRNLIRCTRNRVIAFTLIVWLLLAAVYMDLKTTKKSAQPVPIKPTTTPPVAFPPAPSGPPAPSVPPAAPSPAPWVPPAVTTSTTLPWTPPATTTTLPPPIVTTTTLPPATTTLAPTTTTAPPTTTTPPKSIGKLKLSGAQLVNGKGDPVQLMGISSAGLQWFRSCYTRESLTHLANRWGINVFRAAMYIGEDGYATDKSVLQLVKDIVQWCEELGIYVIVDWHVLNPGDPNHWLTGPGKSQANALDFWTSIASLYKDKQHVIYEICNEPNGVPWPAVKSYADTIIPAIRKIDPDTIIIVGTPTYSQDIQEAAANPVSMPHNVMYAFHFYAGTHGYLLPRLQQFAPTLPVFVTEWGTSEASGNGGPYLDVARHFLDLSHSGPVSISATMWNYADKAEVSAALSPKSCESHNWNAASPTGDFFRNYIKTRGMLTTDLANHRRVIYAGCFLLATGVFVDWMFLKNSIRYMILARSGGPDGAACEMGLNDVHEGLPVHSPHSPS